MHVLVSGENRGQLWHFLRHLFEMLLAMMLGMFAGGAVFVAATGNSIQDAIENHSIALVSVMAFAMTAPMVAWMRHRHHPWNLCLEMSAAMVAPAIALCVLRIADVISGGICGAYCGLSLVAMVGVMVYRQHVGGFDARPRESEQRVTAFFDRALLAEAE